MNRSDKLIMFLSNLESSSAVALHREVVEEEVYCQVALQLCIQLCHQRPIGKLLMIDHPANSDALLFKTWAT